MPFKKGHSKIPVASRNLILRDMGNESNPVGGELSDPFFDDGESEILTCCAIVDSIGLHDKKSITVTIDKFFLKRIVWSHIKTLRALNVE